MYQKLIGCIKEQVNCARGLLRVAFWLRVACLIGVTLLVYLFIPNLKVTAEMRHDGRGLDVVADGFVIYFYVFGPLLLLVLTTMLWGSAIRSQARLGELEDRLLGATILSHLDEYAKAQGPQERALILERLGNVAQTLAGRSLEKGASLADPEGPVFDALAHTAKKDTLEERTIEILLRVAEGLMHAC